MQEQEATVYDFSHDRLRDVAYLEISPIKRRMLHRCIAQALETLHAADLDAVSGQLAAHYEHAGLAPEAITYYHRAGTVAQRIYANEEAISLYRKGLALLAAQPHSAERDCQELVFQAALVVPLAAVAGYGATAVINVCQRARELAERLGQSPHPSVLRALAVAGLSRTRFQEARAIGEQLLRLAQASQDRVLLVEAYYVLGVSFFWIGEFIQARAYLEQAIAHYDPEQSPVHIRLYAQDVKVVCLCRLALVLWYLGYSDQAAQRMGEASALAHALAHPFSLIYCLMWDGMYHQHCGDVATMLARLEHATTLAREHRSDTFLANGMVLQTWASATQGLFADGLNGLPTQVNEHLQRARETGTEFLQRVCLRSVSGAARQARRLCAWLGLAR